MVKVIASNIEMRFGSRLLYHFDQLALSTQQLIHLQGDNGSGKTTLMKLFAGLQAPTQGKVEVQGGRPLPWWRRNPLLEQVIYLHQHPYLFDGTVAFNLNYVHHFCQLGTKQLKQRTADAIEMAQLGSLITQQAASLSGGERQRLAIARAWIINPKILILDEPTSNMDNLSQQLVLTMIENLKQQQTGLLVSSHQGGLLSDLCDQIWHIDNQTISTRFKTEKSIIPNSVAQQELKKHVTAN